MHDVFWCLPFRTVLLILALCVSGVTRAAVSVPDHGVILLYHHIADDTPAITSTSPADFAAQLEYLEQHQFLIWPLPKLIDAIENHKSVPDKVVVITFDDNYRSVYSHAFPLLKKRQWPFTIFVSTDAVDQGINWQANWDQVREMAAQGATIANHSASHAHLLQRLAGEDNQQWRQRISADIDRAQRRIEQETGQRHQLFAYPYGEFNRELTQLVMHLGYIGIGQHSGAYGAHHGGLAIPRFPIAGSYSRLDDFALKVHTLPLPVISTAAPELPLPFNTTLPTLLLTLDISGNSHHAVQCFGTGQGALKLHWREGSEVEVTASQPLPTGRSRFNCTLPSTLTEDGVKRFYWFSYPWIREDAQGHLPD